MFSLKKGSFFEKIPIPVDSRRFGKICQGTDQGIAGQPHYEVFQKDADNTFLQKKEAIPGFSIRQTTFLTILLY
ncbi:MAG: hypothetical protein LBS57_06625, partial [Treponema sp.]|nr:hypothetical protein [Treponema sp.]